MYRLLNLLFGWDYVLIRWCGGLECFRIIKDKVGNVFCCKIACNPMKIESPDNIGWLTCYPSKYFPEDRKEL